MRGKPNYGEGVFSISRPSDVLLDIPRSGPLPFVSLLDSEPVFQPENITLYFNIHESSVFFFPRNTPP